jgi:site-specific DNA-methyltransferase (adenine-specific)
MKIDKTKVYNMDCMEYMQSIPDKYFELALVDPPYGIGEDGKSNHSRGKATKPNLYTPKNWDQYAPNSEYFNLLKLKSKNQIIFGANHFINNIPFNVNSPCWIVWDKQNGQNDFADCELAWTSFNSAVRKFIFRWAGMLQGDMKNKQIRIHPTEKPIKLYEWILMNYAKEGDKILDTHLGSQSSRIASYNLGFEFVGTELDQEYFDQGCKRFENHIKQLTIF